MQGRGEYRGEGSIQKGQGYKQEEGEVRRGVQMVWAQEEITSALSDQ